MDYTECGFFLVLVLFFGLLFCVTECSDNKKEEREHQERMAMIEAGVVPPDKKEKGLKFLFPYTKKTNCLSCHENVACASDDTKRDNS